MADRTAKVSSLDSIESFRNTLILYLNKARPTLEEVSTEVMRTRQWLQHDQQMFWAREAKIRARNLETAQAELFSARLSKIQKATAAQELALHRAQRAMRECEEKRRLLKKWDREVESRSEPLVRQVDQLQGYILGEMSQAMHFLNEIIKTLQAYAETGVHRPTIPPSAPGATGAPDIQEGAESPAETAEEGKA
jgi:hypothetical protein